MNVANEAILELWFLDDHTTIFQLSTVVERALQSILFRSVFKLRCLLLDPENRVITTMVIRLLDDHTLCSIFFHSFGALAKAVRLLLIYPKLCSNDIFDNLQPVRLNLKGGLFDLWLERLGGGIWRWEWADSLARPRVPLGYLLTHMVFFLLLLGKTPYWHRVRRPASSSLSTSFVTE